MSLTEFYPLIQWEKQGRQLFSEIIEHPLFQEFFDFMVKHEKQEKQDHPSMNSDLPHHIHQFLEQNPKASAQELVDFCSAFWPFSETKTAKNGR